MNDNYGLALRITDSEKERDNFPKTFWEILLFTSGKAEIRNGANCFCLNQRERDNIFINSRYIALGFDPRLVNSAFHPEQILEAGIKPADPAGVLDLFWADCFIHREGELPGPIVLYPQSTQFLEEIFNKIRDELTNKSNPYWPYRTRSFLIEALIHLGRIFHQPVQVPDKVTGLIHPAEKVRLYLSTHYSEKISLAGLTREFCTNKTTLEEKFFDLTGKTVFGYLRELRLSIARNLLQETTLPVSEIASKTGFSDPTHFGRVFQKTFRQLPASYRKNFK